MNRNILLFMTAVLLLSGLCIARPADSFVKRSFTGTQMTLPYRVYVPKNYDRNKRYPVVLALHGVAENGDDDSLQVYNQWRVAEVWAEDTNQARNPCFVVAPQCPKKMLWVNVNFFKTPNYDIDTVPVSKPLSTVTELLDSLIREFPIDTNRQYVTGVSMGGFATWYLMMKYPERFAACMPMSGSSDTAMARVVLKIPTWVYHGALDELIPTNNSREMVAAQIHAGRSCVYTHCVNGDSSKQMSVAQIDSAVNAGSRFLFSEWASIGHWGYENLYNHPSFLKWVFKQAKKGSAATKSAPTGSR